MTASSSSAGEGLQANRLTLMEMSQWVLHHGDFFHEKQHLLMKFRCRAFPSKWRCERCSKFSCGFHTIIQTLRQSLRFAYVSQVLAYDRYVSMIWAYGDLTAKEGCKQVKYHWNSVYIYCGLTIQWWLHFPFRKYTFGKMYSLLKWTC